MVLELIQEVRGQGTAVIMISHNLRDVFAVADRVTVMRWTRRRVLLDRRDLLDAVVALMMGASPGIAE